MKQAIKKMLTSAGFNGRIVFRKSKEFGTADSYGPAIHRRWIDAEYEAREILDSVERDGFETVVIYLEPNSYYTYLAKLNNPKAVWTKGEINGLRKGLGYCGPWSDVAKEELSQTIKTTEFNFKITKDQSKFGVDWLKRTQFRLDGRLRASAFIGEREASIIKNFKEFRFIGLRFIYVSPYQTDTAPVYRTISKSGDYFDYSCAPMGGFGAAYEVV